MFPSALIELIEKIKMPHRIAILAGTVVLLAGLFIYLIYLPKSEEIERLEGDVQRLTQSLNQAKIKARSLAKFQEEYKTVSEQFREALNLLPNEREIPALLRSITQQGSDSKLEFILFSPQRERPKDFYVEIPFSLEVNGTYHDVAVFFDKIGRMDRIVNITEVSMKPVAELSTMLSTRCEAVTYRFKGQMDEKPAEKKK
ncbi:MAG: pilus assembly protein PilO [Desulfobacteraceae bacterium]|jgi:type IV pilus assembly protein PilO|nr:MAG: pilus assembly protein PilO [Desulfobacteraceae bacterium]